MLGKGDVYLLPGARLELTNPSNLSPGASIDMASDVLAESVLVPDYNGMPTITGKSTGVIAVETKDFDAITDLSKIGDGTFRLGSFRGGTFIGKTLAPGAGNLYRLGGGGGGPYFGGFPLVIAQPVLVGSAAVEVGSTGLVGHRQRDSLRRQHLHRPIDRPNHAAAGRICQRGHELFGGSRADRARRQPVRFAPGPGQSLQ